MPWKIIGEIDDRYKLGWSCRRRRLTDNYVMQGENQSLYFTWFHFPLSYALSGWGAFNTCVKVQVRLEAVNDSTAWFPSVAASTCGMDKSVGLFLWNQSREQWIGHKKLVNQPQQLREPKLNWNATYDSLFGSNKLLPMSIPLANAHVKMARNGRFPNGFLGAGRTVRLTC
ncbi:hypothetical protein MTR67_015256, partial [Solanum verrucosum]